jgi:UDP-glucose 4-epimerase
MHFCAYSLVGESMTKPLMYFENNVGGAMTLLEVMQDFEVKHIVFSSTAATFGIPEEMPITEKTPQNQSILMVKANSSWKK